MTRRLAAVVLVPAVVLTLVLPVATAPDAVAAAPAPVAAGAAAAAPAATPFGQQRTTPQDSYVWPLPGLPRVGRAFEPPETTYGRGHRGVDLVAAAGSLVLAAGAGTVVFAGPLAGRGVVSVQHPDGLRTTYEPVTAAVSAGDEVLQGAALGTLEPGHTGCPAPVCLHWGVRRGTEYLDPLRLLGRWEVRLLPWAD